MVEKIKTAIRPGLAIWAICMLTAWSLGLLVKEPGGVEITIWSASILQWIPDRAIKRVKDVIKG